MPGHHVLLAEVDVREAKAGVRGFDEHGVIVEDAVRGVLYNLAPGRTLEDGEGGRMGVGRHFGEGGIRVERDCKATAQDEGVG